MSPVTSRTSQFNEEMDLDKTEETHEAQGPPFVPPSSQASPQEQEQEPQQEQDKEQEQAQDQPQDKDPPQQTLQEHAKELKALEEEER